MLFQSPTTLNIFAHHINPLFLSLSLGRRSYCGALFWFTIPDGFYALVTRHGALEDYTDFVTGQKSPVWPCGLHYGPPWLKVSHLVTKQDIVFNAKIDACPTRDNVAANIDLAIVLRVMGEENSTNHPKDNPQNVVKFVHELAPMGLQTQLQGELAASVRTLVRSLDYSNVLGLRQLKCSQVMEGSRKEKESLEAESDGESNGGEASVMDVIKFRLNEQFTCQGIEILSIVVKDISLPTQIQHQLFQKTLIDSQNDVHTIQHQQSMQSLLQEEEIKTLQQTYQLQQIQLLKECEYESRMANLKLDTLHAENERNIQSIEAQMSIDVGLVTVENNMTVQRIADESKLETEKIRVQSKAHGDMELAKVESDVSVIMAKGELEVAKNVAKAENSLRQARILALASISENNAEEDGNNIMTFSPRNVIDLGMLLGGPSLSCDQSRRGVQSLPDKRTLDRQRVLTIMAQRHSSGDRDDFVCI